MPIDGHMPPPPLLPPAFGDQERPQATYSAAATAPPRPSQADVDRATAFRAAHAELEATVEEMRQLVVDFTKDPSDPSLRPRYEALPPAHISLIRGYSEGYPEIDHDGFLAMSVGIYNRTVSPRNWV